MKKLYVGCTLERHRQIGIHAVVNACGGELWRNDMSNEDVELMRDARKIQAWKQSRVCFYQFNSRFFRRNINRVEHLLSQYDD